MVAPFDHRYDVPLEAVRVTLPPAQNVVAPDAVIVAVGVGFTATLTAGAVPEQPVPSVTTTLYEPLADTVIDWVVAPFDHAYDAPAVAVSVTLPPVQKLVGPFGVIVGAKAPTETVAVPLFVQPLPSVIETLSVTGDEEVGWNVIVFVPAPD